MIHIHVDIVGGSFGGLSTAITIKRLNKNISVTVYEKHRNIGYNPEGRRCAEGYIWYPDLLEWGPPSDCIFTTIKNQELVLGTTSYNPPINPRLLSTLIIDKQRFIASLGKKAQDLGIDIRTHDAVIKASDLDGTFIVDASGCPSLLRKDLGFRITWTAKSYQQTIENANVFRADTVRFFFKNSPGYYWIFPRDTTKREINLGMGVMDTSSGGPKDLLLSFKQELGIQGDVNYVTGGLIPIGLQYPLRHENILFVGDAGVGTFPFSGEGTTRAILSGIFAARSIVSGKPHRYPRLVTREFLRWDLIGKTFIKMGRVLQKIGDNSYDVFTNTFFRLIYFPSFF